MNSERAESKERSSQQSSSKRGPRVSKACVNCRRRKIRCTGERPQCRYCATYRKQCSYEELAKRQRPTHAHIERLQEELRQLKEPASPSTEEHENPASTSKPTGFESSARSYNSSTSPAPANNQRPDEDSSSRYLTVSHANTYSPPANPPPTPYGPTSTYHGPTSASHDGAVHERRPHRWFTAEREALMPNLLFAEAARQRQLEKLNANLDFDGVDPELAWHLLDLHWNRQHHAFLVTYRPAFMRDMACGGPYFSRILLNAIYFGAAKFSPRLELRKVASDVRTAGWKFRDRVRDLLGRALDYSNITTIQALLLMCNSLFSLGDEPSAAWIYVGNARSMIIDLGLHVDVTERSNLRHLSDEDIEIRRRVFWAAFVIDKIQSLYQGRNAVLQEADCNVPIKFLDEYEELEHWQPFAYASTSEHSGSPCYNVSTFTEMCKLSIILNQVSNTMYRERRKARPLSHRTKDLENLDKALLDWRAELPTHLANALACGPDTSVPPPHVLSLRAIWHVLRILLHRPFVLDSDPTVRSSPTTRACIEVCSAEAANIVQLVRLYDASFSVRQAPYLVSYATYVAATIHVRLASSSRPGSTAHQSLAVCLTVLDLNSKTNPAVRKASVVIEALMKAMNVSMEERQESTRASREIENAVNASANPATDSTPHPPAKVVPNESVQEATGPQQQLAPQPYVPFDANANGMMPPDAQAAATDVPNGSYLGSEYFGDFAFGMDDILFGFNASESIFQDFM